jgi:methylated-DNA-[protein]-cysteine S-methyltransferase
LTGFGGVKIPGALMGAIVDSNSLSATLTRYSVPGWGTGELWMAGEVVLAHDFIFAGQAMSAGGAGDTRANPPKGAGGAGADRLIALLTDFLDGVPVSLDEVEIDLTWATPFQSAVADALRGVPRAEIVTYGELAAAAGYPGAARAAGSFCAGNRHALLVPCHRVIAANGIGGYGATGVDVKRRLLALEGVVL